MKLPMKLNWQKKEVGTTVSLSCTRQKRHSFLLLLHLSMNLEYGNADEKYARQAHRLSVRVTYQKQRETQNGNPNIGNYG